MHSLAGSFRTNIVEGRFFPFLVSIVVLAMRWGLYSFGHIPHTAQVDDNYLFNPIASLFENPQISFIASTLSVFIIASILYYFNNKFGITRTRSNLPFIIPLFLLSLHPYFLVMSGSFIAVIFILLAFFPLLESYQKPDPYLYSFRSATLIGVASLFQIQVLFLLPLWWKGENSMRGPQVSSFIASVFGVLLVYVSAFAVFAFQDNIGDFIQPFYSFSSISLLEIPEFTLAEWVTAFFVFAFFVFSMILSVKASRREKVLTLSYMRFIQFLIFFLLILQLIYWRSTTFFLVVTIVFIAVLNAYLFTRTTKKSGVVAAYVLISIAVLFYFSHFFPELNFSF